MSEHSIRGVAGPARGKLSAKRSIGKGIQNGESLFERTPYQAAIQVLRSDQPALPNLVHTRVLNRQVHGRQQGGVRPVTVFFTLPDA